MSLYVEFVHYLLCLFFRREERRYSADYDFAVITRIANVALFLTVYLNLIIVTAFYFSVS